MPIYTKTCRFKPFPLVGIRARYVSDRRTGILQPRWSDKRYAMSRIAFFFFLFLFVPFFLFSAVEGRPVGRVRLSNGTKSPYGT